MEQDKTQVLEHIKAEYLSLMQSVEEAFELEYNATYKDLVEPSPACTDCSEEFDDSRNNERDSECPSLCKTCATYKRWWVH